MRYLLIKIIMSFSVIHNECMLNTYIINILFWCHVKFQTLATDHFVDNYKNL